MKYEDTAIYKNNSYRYAKIVAEIFEGCDIVVSLATINYDGAITLCVENNTELEPEGETKFYGYVFLLGKKPNGSYIYYAWDFNSDNDLTIWERDCYSYRQIKQDMHENKIVFNTLEDLKAYFGLLRSGEFGSCYNDSMMRYGTDRRIYRFRDLIIEHLEEIEEDFCDPNLDDPNKPEVMILSNQL